MKSKYCYTCYTPEHVQSIKVEYAQSLAKEVIEGILTYKWVLPKSMYGQRHNEGLQAAINLIKAKFDIK